MSYQLILFFITVGFIAITTFLVPYLKRKGLWVVTLFAVNLIEQVYDFFEMKGAGQDKYKWVETILLSINPKLTDEEVELLIEELVSKMNEIKLMQ